MAMWRTGGSSRLVADSKMKFNFQILDLPKLKAHGDDKT